MTLKEIEALPREYLVPAEIAGILDMDPQDIRDTVHQAYARNTRPFEFPTIVSGSRIKFPKMAFLNFMRGEATSCREPK
jgi:hypothetical protein